MEVKKLGNLLGHTGGNFAGNVYDMNALSPTIRTVSGGNTQPMIVVGSTQKNAFVGDGNICPTLTEAMGKGGGQIPMIIKEDTEFLKVAEATEKGYAEATKKGYAEATVGDSINTAYPGSKTRRGRVGHGVAQTIMTSDEQVVVVKNPNPELVGGIGEKNFGKQFRQDNRVYNSESVAMCLTSQPLGNAGGNSYLYSVKEQTDNLRIRKLTPKECYRLMGFDDAAFEKAEKVNSNTQLYKQAGNSIVVDVLMAIFDNLLIHSRSVWLDNLLETDEEVS